MAKRVLYLSDYNGEDEKYYQKLLEMFPEREPEDEELTDEGDIVPGSSVDPDYDEETDDGYEFRKMDIGLEKNPAEVLMKEAAEGPNDIVIGTGLGGIFAIILGRLTQCKTILINPLYPFSRYAPDELPNYAFAQLLVDMTEEIIVWDNGKESVKNMELILGKDDDILDTPRTPAYFHNHNAHFVDGGHYPDGEDFYDCLKAMIEGTEQNPEKKRVKTGSIVMSMQIVGTEESSSEDKYKDVDVRGFDGSDGNFSIKWAFSSSSSKEHTLYLYYSDGKWYADTDYGNAGNQFLVLAILQKAARLFTVSTTPVKHEGQGWWGWDW